MTKLDAVLARIRQLPPERQDMIAVEMEFLLDHGDPGPQLTAEQEAELSRRLADPSKRYLSHEEVAARLEEKYGR